MRTRFFRILVLVGMLTISIGPSYAALAADVTTSATVAAGSGGTPTAAAPRIECKWELPDTNSNPTVLTGFPDVNVQVGADDPNPGGPNGPTLANGSTATTPCDLAAPTTAEPVGKPTMPNNSRHMIQVRANAHDLPEQRRILLLAAIDAPSDGSGISTATNGVNWDIYHPDGTLKIEVYGTRVPVAQCAGLGNSTTGVFGAGVTTGQLSVAAVDNATRGLAYWCTQGKQIWWSEFRLSKHQPCGEYTIKLTANAGNGTGSSTLVNTIDVICFTQLELDFNAVNYGTITPGFGKVIPGDLKWEGALCPACTAQDPGPVMPTVRNTGNSGMAISVKFSDMCNGVAPSAAGLCPSGVDKISSFDACFAAAATYSVAAATAGDGITAQSLLCKDPIFSNTTTTLRDDAAPGPQTLCANRVGKLDLSIHPQSGISAGTYQGTLTVLSVASKVCLTDNGHIDTTTVSSADNPAYPGLPVGTGLQPGDNDPNA